MLPIKKNTKEKGVAILFMVMIMSVVLSVGLGISAVSIQQSRLMTAIGTSITAFYNAETGAERVLFYLYKKPEEVNPQIGTSGNIYYVIVGLSPDNECAKDNPPENCPNLLADENCTSKNFCLKSLGTFKKTKRAIEVKY